MQRKKTQKPKVLVIVGPTASGKTSLSITLAQKLNGEIISADSRQVYRGLNLGTGKVTKKEMAGIPHHLLDIASPKKVFSVSDYVTEGRKAIADIQARGKLPIICGGTGFYIDALLGRISVPDVPPNPNLRKKLERKSAETLFRILQKKDPERAATIDKHNSVRLIRAIEIATALGKVPSKQTEELYSPLFIGIAPEEKTLKQNIRTRLIERLRLGLLREVRNLHTKGLSWKRMEELGLEYRYVSRHLRGLLTKEEMFSQLEMEILHYAKRQYTWFRKNKNIAWISSGSTPNAMKLAQKSYFL